MRSLLALVLLLSPSAAQASAPVNRQASAPVNAIVAVAGMVGSRGSKNQKTPVWNGNERRRLKRRDRCGPGVGRRFRMGSTRQGHPTGEKRLALARIDRRRHKGKRIPTHPTPLGSSPVNPIGVQPRDRHPARAELVIEAADTTLGLDLVRKARIYAAAGFPVYWVIDLQAGVVHIHTDPGPDGYNSVARHGPDDLLDACGVSLRLQDLLPT